MKSKDKSVLKTASSIRQVAAKEDVDTLYKICEGLLVMIGKYRVLTWLFATISTIQAVLLFWSTL